MYEYTIINILKSFFTLESLNILRCYISFNNVIHKPKLMLPEFFIVITRFNRTRFNRTRYNRTRYNRTQNHGTRNHRTLILSTALKTCKGK